MAIQNPQDLFLYDLRAMYDVEQQLLQMLPVLARECMDHAAREAFVTHELETRQHVSNLEQCFKILGSEPATLANNTVAGLTKDHDAFLQQQPPAQALTLFNLRAGYMSECLEIAGYQSLIDEAKALGLTDCVQLFQQNLQQEINASQKLSAIAHQYGLQQVQPAQPVQNAVAAVPTAQPVQNAVPVAPTAPAPNPYAVPNVPIQPYGNTNGPVQVQEGLERTRQPENTTDAPVQVPVQEGTTSPQPQQANYASQVQVGMPVVGSDMNNVGLVKKVGDDDFLVDIPMQRDLYIPFSAVQNVDADQVVLNVSKDQVHQMNWAKPPLF